MHSLSFPNFNEFSAVTRLFHGAGTAGAAAMDPVEGAGCRCRVPICREPCVQQWILQRVQGASDECCRAEYHACSEKSALSHLQTADLEPQRSAIFVSHMRWSCSLSRCHSWPSNSVIQNSSTSIFSHSACVLSACMGLCDLSDRLGGRISEQKRKYELKVSESEQGYE